jgi:hypothetical protein
MYFEVFNTIVFDAELDLITCLDDEYVRAAMTLDEIIELVPNVKTIMEAKSFEEILVASNYLIDDLPLPTGTLERWEKHGLNEFEKYCVAFLYASLQLEDKRYRICRICGKPFFSMDEFSEVCPKCSDRYPCM